MLAIKRFFNLSIVSLCCFVIPQLAVSQTPSAIAIASSNPYATNVGEAILLEGGNAFDAAVAITAMLAVVEPYSSGLGGGGFWLLHRASDGKQVIIDGREMAPGAAHQDMYLDKHDQPIPGSSTNGPLAAAIPGTLATIQYLADHYGQLPFTRTLTEAIRYAEEGFEVTKRYQLLSAFRLEALQAYPQTAAIFLRDNRIPTLGHRIVQPDLANTLRRMVKHGAKSFYSGEFAVRMAQSVRKYGGIWEAQDLANYHIVERKPIVFNYYDIKVVSVPPPSSGGVVLAQALGMLEQFDLKAHDPITRKHIIVEAMRRAYRDRAIFLGDPDFVRIPVDRLLHKDYLAGLAISINPQQATASENLSIPLDSAPGSHTTHFSILDQEGNRVSATLSINTPFGSAFVVPGSGVLLNNEMDDFSIKARTPNTYGLLGETANAIRAGKRPLSSMSPVFLETHDRVGILGTPGGSRIISMVLLGILDFSDNQGPDSWVSLPRYHHQYFPDELVFEENGLSFAEQEALKKYGHILKEKNRRYGNMQAVLWDKTTNNLFSASDPRGEGKAIVTNILKR